MAAGGGITRRDAWTSGELQVIYDLVNELFWFGHARALLPRRSDNAIRVKMTMLRMEAGIVPRCPGPRSMSTRNADRERAAQASDRLRIAIKQLEPA